MKYKNIIFLQNKLKKLKRVYKYDIDSLSNNRLDFIKEHLEKKHYSFKHIILILNNIYNITKKKLNLNKKEHKFYQKIQLIMKKDINDLQQFVKNQRIIKNNSTLYIEPRKEKVTVSVELLTYKHKRKVLTKNTMILVRNWYQERLKSYIGCMISNITILDVSINDKNIVITFSCFGSDENIETEKSCMADPDDDVNYPLKVLTKLYMVIGKKI